MKCSITGTLWERFTRKDCAELNPSKWMPHIRVLLAFLIVVGVSALTLKESRYWLKVRLLSALY